MCNFSRNLHRNIVIKSMTWRGNSRHISQVYLGLVHSNSEPYFWYWFCSSLLCSQKDNWELSLLHFVPKTWTTRAHCNCVSYLLLTTRSRNSLMFVSCVHFEGLWRERRNVVFIAFWLQHMKNHYLNRNYKLRILSGCKLWELRWIFILHSSATQRHIAW
jgi:hypothetical protein